MEPMTFTAPEIAAKLDLNPKMMRAWMRNQGWRSEAEKGTRWVLTPDQVEQLKSHFGAQDSRR